MSQLGDQGPPAHSHRGDPGESGTVAGAGPNSGRSPGQGSPSRRCPAPGPGRAGRAASSRSSPGFMVLPRGAHARLSRARESRAGLAPRPLRSPPPARPRRSRSPTGPGPLRRSNSLLCRPPGMCAGSGPSPRSTRSPGSCKTAGSEGGLGRQSWEGSQAGRGCTCPGSVPCGQGTAAGGHASFTLPCASRTQTRH